MNRPSRWALLALLVFGSALGAEELALVGGTVINPGDEKTVSNATVIIAGNRITRVAPTADSKPPAEAKMLTAQVNSFCPATSIATFTFSNRAISSLGRTGLI